jgi:hypothetical protein
MPSEVFMRIKVQCADQTPPNNSRRGFLKNAAALAAAAAPGKAVPQSKDSEIVERISRRNPDANHRILLKGGTIVSMDPKVGDFVKGDLLIQGKKIAAVGASLQRSGEVIDASNTILIRLRSALADSSRLNLRSLINRSDGSRRHHR